MITVNNWAIPANNTSAFVESAKDFVLEKGTNLKFGARPLRRAIQRYIEDEISEKILRKEFSNGQKIIVTRNNDSLVFGK